MGDANLTTINTVVLPHWTPEYVQFVSDLNAIGRKWLEDNNSKILAMLALPSERPKGEATEEQKRITLAGRRGKRPRSKRKR